MELSGAFSAQLAAQSNEPSSLRTRNAEKAREVAQDFEAHVISAFAESMFAEIPTDGPFGGGHGESVFRSLLIQEYGKEMSQSGGIGIADNVFKEILKLQEVSQ